MKLSWSDVEEIGIRLHRRFPGLDPLTARFIDLHRYVTELEGFDDNPQASTEGILEAIQMAWLEEWRDKQESSG